VRTLVFPLRGVRLITAGTLGLMVLGGVILLLTGSPIVLLLSACIALAVAIAIAIIMPKQMLSMVSSKQLFWVPGLRNKTFVILCSINCLVALLFLLLLESKPNDFSLINILALLFLTLGLVSALMLFGSVYFQWFTPFIFVGVWGLYLLVGERLYDLPLVNFFLCALVWLCLFRWWQKWVPQKYFRNDFLFSTEKLHEKQKSRSAGINLFHYWRSLAPRSLCGTLLIGGSDGVKSRLAYEFGQMVVIFLMLMVFFFVLRGSPSESVLKILPVIIFTFIAARNSQMQVLCYRLHPVWLYFDRPRIELLSYLEKQYFLNMAIVCVEVILVLLAIHFLFDSIGLIQELIVFTAVAGNLFSCVLFYVGWIIYQKTEANIQWLGWINGILIAVILIILGLNSIFGTSDINYIELWSETAILLVLAILARYKAVNAWKKMNFYRVKS
jgi:hypothetical protein